MTDIHDNRWVPAETEFARRVEVADLGGFFARKLTIEPGVKAMFLENGQSLGEVPPGQYTLQGLAGKLAFWSQKKLSAILARQGEVPVDLLCEGLPTQELLSVEVAVRLLVQIEDVALFQKNLLGSRPVMTVEELRDTIQPVVRQALWETVGRLSIRDLTGEQARGDLELCVSQALGTSLLRNGLKFTQVQTLSVSHAEYDEYRNKTGQMWLQRLGLEHDQAAARLAADQLYQSIQQQEKTNELELLAEQVAADQMEGKVGLRVRRVAIRRQLREAVLAGQFDELNAEAKLTEFRQQRDKEQLIRDDEYATLEETLRDKTSDRQSVRAHLLRKLEIEQQSELDGLKIDLDYAQRLKSRRHEIALAEINDSEESRQWKVTLQRELTESEHRRSLQLKQLDAERADALAVAETAREEQWQGKLQAQRLSRLEGDIRQEQAEREQRVAQLEAETSRYRSEAEDDLARMKAERDREITRNADLDQLERLKLTQQMNIDFQRQQAEIRRDDQRLTAELENLKEDKTSQRTLARIQAMRGMSVAELIATAEGEKGSLLVDLEKHKATEQTNAFTAQAQITAAMQNDTRLQAMQDKLNESQKQSMEQTLALMKEMMANQQTAFSGFGNNMENLTKNLAPQPGQPVYVNTGATPPLPGGANAAPARKLVCNSCRAENPETSRHCANCGKPL